MFSTVAAGSPAPSAISRMCRNPGACNGVVKPPCAQVRVADRVDGHELAQVGGGIAGGSGGAVDAGGGAGRGQPPGHRRLQGFLCLAGGIGDVGQVRPGMRRGEPGGQDLVPLHDSADLAGGRVHAE